MDYFHYFVAAAAFGVVYFVSVAWLRNQADEKIRNAYKDDGLFSKAKETYDNASTAYTCFKILNGTFNPMFWLAKTVAKEIVFGPGKTRDEIIAEKIRAAEKDKANAPLTAGVVAAFIACITFNCCAPAKTIDTQALQANTQKSTQVQSKDAQKESNVWLTKAEEAAPSNLTPLDKAKWYANKIKQDLFLPALNKEITKFSHGEAAAKKYQSDLTSIDSAISANTPEEIQVKEIYKHLIAATNSLANGFGAEKLETPLKNAETDLNKALELANTQTITMSQATAGVINRNEVNVRKGPGEQHKSLGVFFKGDIVKIVNKTITANNETWFKIEYQNPNVGLISGYVNNQYIDITEGNTLQNKTVNTQPAVSTYLSLANDMRKNFEKDLLKPALRKKLPINQQTLALIQYYKQQSQLHFDAVAKDRILQHGSDDAKAYYYFRTVRIASVRLESMVTGRPDTYNYYVNEAVKEFYYPYK